MTAASCHFCADRIPLVNELCPSCGRLVLASYPQELTEMVKVTISTPSEAEAFLKGDLGGLELRCVGRMRVSRHHSGS